MDSLFSLAHNLLVYGLDGSPIYVDQFTRLNRDVYEQALDLYGTRGKTVEAEVLDRSWEVLPKLPASLLKVRLLTYCYSEVYDKELAQEAHAIINTWDQSQLTLEQVEIIEDLKNFEENQYPWDSSYE